MRRKSWPLRQSAQAKETISFKSRSHKLSQTTNRWMFITSIWNNRENNMMTRYWLSSNNNTKTIREINWITSLWSQFKTPILQTITASILSPFCSRLSTISWSSQPTISFWQISSSKKPKWASKTTKKYLRKFTKPPLTSHSVSNHKIWKWLTLQGTTGTRNLLKSHFPRTFPAQSWNKRVLMRDFWCSNQTDFRFWTVN